MDLMGRRNETHYYLEEGLVVGALDSHANHPNPYLALPKLLVSNLVDRLRLQCIQWRT